MPLSEEELRLLEQMEREYPTSKNRWNQVVPPSSGYFNSVLALDVIHDDLSSTTLARYESSMDRVAEWYWAADRGWGTATYGARAVWATYHPSAAIRFGPRGAPRAGLLADLTAVAGTLA